MRPTSLLRSGPASLGDAAITTAKEKARPFRLGQACPGSQGIPLELFVLNAQGARADHRVLLTEHSVSREDLTGLEPCWLPATKLRLCRTLGQPLGAVCTRIWHEEILGVSGNFHETT